MSFVQVKERTGGGLPSSGAMDRTPFYGARVPEQVKIMLKAIKGMDQSIIKKTLKSKVIQFISIHIYIYIYIIIHTHIYINISIYIYV